MAEDTRKVEDLTVEELRERVVRFQKDRDAVGRSIIVAQKKAEEILADAKQQADRIVEEANRKREQVLEALRQEIAQLEAKKQVTIGKSKKSFAILEKETARLLGAVKEAQKEMETQLEQVNIEAARQEAALAPVADAPVVDEDILDDMFADTPVEPVVAPAPVVVDEADALDITADILSDSATDIGLDKVEPGIADLEEMLDLGDDDSEVELGGSFAIGGAIPVAVAPAVALVESAPAVQVTPELNVDDMFADVPDVAAPTDSDALLEALSEDDLQKKDASEILFGD